MTKYCENVAQTEDVQSGVNQATHLRLPCVPCLSRQSNGDSWVERQRQTRKGRSRVPTLFNSSLRLLIVFTLVRDVSCQNTLTVTLTPSATYVEERKQANITCTLSSSATPTSSDFPLTWDRPGGLQSLSPLIRTNQTTGSGGETIYLSTLFFTPAALDNDINIVCNAKIGSLTGSSNYLTRVILVPSLPVVTGPDSVEADRNYTWTCQVDGASQNAPNVYWRNGAGIALTTGISKVTTYQEVPNNNKVFSITTTVTTAIPPKAASDSLTCTVVHAVDLYSSKKTGVKTFNVFFPPQITKDGENTITTIVGQRVTLSCVISGSNPAALNVSWTKDGATINLASGQYEPVSTNSPNLTIVSPVRGDRGDYTCTVANNRGSSSFLTPTTLVVTYPPSINNTGNSITINGSAGGSLTIPCPVDAVPPPTDIRWKRIVNGQIQTITVSGNPRYSGGTVVNKQYDLTINPVQGDDAGTYFCEAVNDLGTGEGSNTTVTVNYEPVVNVPAYVTAKEGENFMISCRITMYPAVTSVVWFKENTVLNIAGSSGKYSGGTVQNPSLMVQSAAKSDSGSYKCQGNNGTMTVSGTTAVTITYAPKITVPPSDIIGRSGQTVTIPCSFDADPPATSIIWRKRAYGSNTTADVVIGGNISGGNLSVPSLTITNLTPGDMGTYYCVVSNSNGNSTSGQVNLQVRYTPIVKVTSTPNNLTFGEKFQLICTADAYPEITSYAWYKNNAKVSGTTEYTKFEAVLSDYTDFRCDVTNVVGTSSATIRPNIEFSPQLVGTGKDIITAKIKDTIKLQCLVIANPEATAFSWYKRSDLIGGANQKNFSLLLSEDSDFGDYSCSAQNIYNQLYPARKFTVIKDDGSSVASASLSTSMLVLIVLIVIIFLIIIFLLVICCCLHGVCADKRNKAKVNPEEAAAATNINGESATPFGSKPSDTMNGAKDNDDKFTVVPIARSKLSANGNLETTRSSSPSDVNPNGIINLNDENDYPLGFPSARSNLSSTNNHGSIISVPEKTGPRPYHLPPIDPEVESTGVHPKEDEKRRSRRKKTRKHKSEEKNALTGSEERTDTNSPPT